jgi:hypothetical protein
MSHRQPGGWLFLLCVCRAPATCLSRRSGSARCQPRSPPPCLARHSLQAHVRDLKALVRQGQPRLRGVEVSRCLSAALRLTGSEVKRRCFPMLETAPVPPVRADEGRLIQVLARVLLECTSALELTGPAPIPLAAVDPRPPGLGGGLHRPRRRRAAKRGRLRRLSCPARRLWGHATHRGPLPDGGTRISVRLPRFAEA